MKTILTGALALAMFGFASVSDAATDTTTFNVKLTINSTCDIHTTAATDVNFAASVSTATNIDAQGNLVVNCTPLTAYTIALNKGLNGTDINSRSMKNGAILVPYQLYRLAARTGADIWGETIGAGGNVFSGTGTGANVNVPVFGRVPSANFAAGNYVDTITATITY
jgi:spore coat protein U-like protein